MFPCDISDEKGFAQDLREITPVMTHRPFERTASSLEGCTCYRQSIFEEKSITCPWAHM